MRHATETYGRSADEAWAAALSTVIEAGRPIAPRGQPTVELHHATVVIDALRPVITNLARQLSYRFAAAEALWILSGDDRVETIAPYNPNIAQFSDDGVIFQGAYGPRVVSQLDYVHRKLVEERDTRQAWLTIWRENPTASRDIPCTIALGFSIRESRLEGHAYMRSSDLWLGLPYDLFNFSVILYHVAIAYNRTGAPPVIPGKLCLTAASSHLYERDFTSAVKAVSAHEARCAEAPRELFDGAPERGDQLLASLYACRDRTEAVTKPLWRVRP